MVTTTWAIVATLCHWISFCLAYWNPSRLFLLVLCLHCWKKILGENSTNSFILFLFCHQVQILLAVAYFSISFIYTYSVSFNIRSVSFNIRSRPIFQSPFFTAWEFYTCWCFDLAWRSSYHSVCRYWNCISKERQTNTFYWVSCLCKANGGAWLPPWSYYVIRPFRCILE